MTFRSLAASSLVIVVVAAVNPPAVSETPPDPEFWSFLEKGQTVKRCTPRGPAHVAATAALRRLGDRIRRLRTVDAHGSVVDDLHRLLRTECLHMAIEANRVPNPDSSVSLKTWWDEGGRAWLRSYLELPELGPTSALQPHIVVPPDTRRTMALEGNRSHALQSLLCPSGDDSCGAATRGWVARADAYFESYRALGRDDGHWPHQPRVDDVMQQSTACATSVRHEEPQRKYRAWRACIDRERPVRTALPLGEFKAPDFGWFVIAGRRGHYDFCDTTRVYDLETGTTFTSDSCSALALQPGGRVNVQQTNQQRQDKIESGVVSLDNLREAVWMLLFRSEAETVQLTAEYYPLPAEYAPEITVEDPDDSIHWAGASWNSSQTRLVWRWIRPGQPALDGEVTWPGSYDAAEDHAASLLNIAEKSFARGCPPRSLPDSLSISPRQPVNPVDAPGESVDRALAAAIDKWKAVPACRR